MTLMSTAEYAFFIQQTIFIPASQEVQYSVNKTPSIYPNFRHKNPLRNATQQACKMTLNVINPPASTMRSRPKQCRIVFFLFPQCVYNFQLLDIYYQKLLGGRQILHASLCTFLISTSTDAFLVKIFTSAFCSSTPTAYFLGV